MRGRRERNGRTRQVERRHRGLQPAGSIRVLWVEDGNSIYSAQSPSFLIAKVIITNRRSPLSQAGTFASTVAKDGVVAALKGMNWRQTLAAGIDFAKKQVSLPGVDAVGSVLTYYLQKQDGDKQQVLGN